MKECFKCGAEKPLSDFYKHKQMKDGHLNKCKLCAKSDSTRHRDENLEKVRAYDRDRGMLPHRVKARAEYSKTEAGIASHEKSRRKYVDNNKEKIYQTTKRYKQANKKKTQCHGIVNYAVRCGNLSSGPCEVCGAGNTHGHHDDYNKPLDVRWLCPKHHIEWHAKNGEGLNAS